jgi:capsular polysaccharide transport system permease protein
VIKRTPFQIQRAVIFALLMRELKTRFGGHWTGVLWLFLDPLMKLAMFTWLFTIVRGHTKHGVFDFAVFLFVAMVPFQLGVSLWKQLMNGIKANKGLFGYKQVKPLDTLIARTILEFSISVVVFLVGLAVLGRLGFDVMWPADLLAYLVAVLAFVMIGFGLGLVSAVGVNYLPRLEMVVSMLSMPLQIISGVVFPLSSLPREATDFLLYNPLLHLVEILRASFLPGYQMLQGTSVTYPMVWILICWSLGLLMYWVRRRELAEGRR